MEGVQAACMVGVEIAVYRREGVFKVCMCVQAACMVGVEIAVYREAQGWCLEICVGCLVEVMCKVCMAWAGPACMVFEHIHIWYGVWTGTKHTCMSGGCMVVCEKEGLCRDVWWCVRRKASDRKGVAVSAERARGLQATGRHTQHT